jgi:serine/alanine adding enzyme
VVTVADGDRLTAGAAAVHVTAAATQAVWDAYIHAHADATSDHLWGWRTVFEEVFGQEPVYLTAWRHGAVVGVLPLVRFRSRLFGRSVVSLPFLNYGGLLTSDEAAGNALVEAAISLAREFKASHVELRHRQRQRLELPCRAHKLALARPLPRTSEELWKETDRKVRNQVRKAQKEGLTAGAGGSELVGDFYGVFAENMRDLGTPVYAKRLFEQTLRAFEDRVRIVCVRLDGRTVAGAVMIRFRDTVLVPWASSLRAFRPLCPNMLLYWTMIEQATVDGARVFDFGRSSPDAGTHHFKLQWGAEASPLHWEYVLLTRESVPDQGPRNPRFGAAIEQ